MNANLYVLIQSRFPTDTTAPCLYLEDGRVISYGTIETESARFAKLLIEFGVLKGDRVAVQVDKSAEAVLLYLACLRVGAVYLPLNSAYTATEIEYFLGNAKPRIFVCQGKTYERMQSVAKACGCAHTLTLNADATGTLMDAAKPLEPDHTIVEMATDDLAAILYTSGTTGRSKGAMLSHENLSSNALCLHELWGWQPGDVLIHALPIFHVHGLFVALHCALLNGSAMWFQTKFDADVILELMQKCTIMMGVPTFYTRLVTHAGLTKKSVSNMRLFISGSAPLLKETFIQFHDMTDHHILERYGMTEAGMITSNPLNGDRIPATVGFALPGVDARVTDGNGTVLDTGEIGVLEIKGPNVFKGYWEMPEKTAEEFRDDGYFITGDLSTMDADGRVAIVGRNKDLIISGGYNVYPKEVEDFIDDIDGVIESAVIGLAHPDFGEAVAAVVVVSDKTAVTQESILTALSGELAKFKQPKRVFVVDELPRNTMGKVQKKQLRDEYADTF